MFTKPKHAGGKRGDAAGHAAAAAIFLITLMGSPNCRSTSKPREEGTARRASIRLPHALAVSWPAPYMINGNRTGRYLQ